MEFGFMPKRGTIDAYLSQDGCKKSIMLMEKCNMSCGHKESFLHNTEESVGMGNEEEKNIGSLG